MSAFLEFNRAEHEAKFELTVWGNTAMLGAVVFFTAVEGRFGLMPIAAPWNWLILIAYAATVGFYWWALRNWRAVPVMLLVAAFMDNIAVASTVWRFGGFGSFAAAGFLITLTIAILASGIRYSILYALVQLSLLVAMGMIEGEAIVGQWLLLYLIFMGVLLGLPGAIYQWSRKRASELAERTATLEEKSASLQQSVEELARIGEAQIDALIKAEQLAMIGTLAPTIVHDLKNPLGALSSVAETSKETLEKLIAAGEDSPVVAEVASDLGVMRGQLRRLREIVQGILNLSRQSVGYNDTFQPAEAARDALEAIGLQLREYPKIELRSEVGEKLPEIRGNRGQYSQVLVNLLWNAVQALGEEGGVVALHLKNSGGEVVAEVADSGHGVPHEARQKIFEPFYTTKEARQGTGLGLYLCLQIVERHGGHIEVKESPLGGALFRIAVPVVS